MECSQCQVKTTNPKFCSRSCSVTWHNRNNPKRHKKDGISTSRDTPCPACGEMVSGQSTYHSKCWGPARREGWIAKFEDGDPEIASRTYGVAQWAKDYLLEKHNRTCVLCGWGELHPVDGRPLVQVDHIDGNALNSQISNLNVICPNCHSMTASFGNRNRGNGRKRRRELYNSSEHATCS